VCVLDWRVARVSASVMRPRSEAWINKQLLREVMAAFLDRDENDESLNLKLLHAT
jgi:hypothetical protein